MGAGARQLNLAAELHGLSDLARRAVHAALAECRLPDGGQLGQDELDGLGYITSLTPVAVPGGTSYNVIADRTGGQPGSRQLVVVTAHLNSINLPGGAAATAPGADDNGSGSAGVLEIARVLASHPAGHDLRLILFGGEEQGLHGSVQHVASLTSVERARIRAVINMDMIATLNTAAPRCSSKALRFRRA